MNDETQRQYEMRFSFTATSEQAARFKDTLEAAMQVFFDPTQENASVLFRMGAEAVATVAATSREVCPSPPERQSL